MNTELSLYERMNLGLPPKHFQNWLALWEFNKAREKKRSINFLLASIDV